MALAIALSLPDPLRLRAELADGNGSSVALFGDMRRRLGDGRHAIRDYFEARGSAEVVHRELAQLMDGLVQGALDYADQHLFHRANPTTGEQMAVLAVGGYGRGELAPFSDVDLLFLHSYKRTPYIEQMVEALLMKLWDLDLKVGPATRSVRECIKLAREDLSVATALLEARLLWGDRGVFEELRRNFQREVIAGREAELIEAKLAERDKRHDRYLDSRYLLEPNIKEGKGGLRDLHTLVWIGRILYQIGDVGDLVRHEVLSRRDLNVFLKSRRFLWTVRCHLHYLAGRAEERLTFDLQPEIARRMGYRDRRASSGVERFMKHYYLVAKNVGTLTRVVCAALEESNKRKPRFGLPRFGFGRRRLNGFMIQGMRVDLAEPDLLERRPVAMLELFHLAQDRELDIHPNALRAVSASARKIGPALREDSEANRLLLEMLCSRKDPALTLTRMNEAGLLGRFVPDFGRVIALMQHNLYHVYTVDEHSIRAVGILGQIERGELKGELPLATELMPKILSRSELYLATFLHDMGKGRGGNHSVVGAEIAERLCRRLGLSDAAAETVVWLVRHHLVMSSFAFKRDTEDPKTLQDFVEIVQSPERLRLLLVLTAADIRAVGPNVWNGWKGQLLRELYHEAAAFMASDDARGRRAARIEAAKEALAQALGRTPQRWPPEAIRAYIARHDPRYWLGAPLEDQIRHAELIHDADGRKAPLTVDFHIDRFRARTEVLLYTQDHHGLFMQLAGALALSNVSIVDARIFTTTDGMALDILGCQDVDGRSAVQDSGRLARIEEKIRGALSGEIRLDEEVAGRRARPHRTDVFTVEPRVLVDNAASRTHSVIEINGRDRPGLLYDLAKILKQGGLVITSAHISTYGERVVDVLYVKDVFGMKLTAKTKLGRLERELKQALAGPWSEASA